MQMAVALGKEANAKYIQELGVAIRAIKFASRMKRRRNANKPPKPAAEADKKPADATSADTKPPDATPVGHNIRFDFDLKLFTADLERRSLRSSPSTSRFLRSTCSWSRALLARSFLKLKYAIRRVPRPRSSLRSEFCRSSATRVRRISPLLGYPVLDKSVVSRQRWLMSDAKPKASPRATPGYAPSPRHAKPPEAAKAADGARLLTRAADSAELSAVCVCGEHG